MLHVIRSHRPCGRAVLTAVMECDGCGRTAPELYTSTSPENLPSDRIRLRIAARRRRWGQYTIPLPADPAGGEPTWHRVDLCPECRCPRSGPRLGLDSRRQ